MTATAVSTTRTVQTWDSRVPLRFTVVGDGPPLVYLHPAGGLILDDFIESLSTTNTVYAPELPGVAAGDSFSIHEVDDIFDLVLAYEGAFRSLGLQGAPVVGQSFGGMLAAELASCFPDLFSKVVLLDPAGLWNESEPWSLDFMSGPPEQLASLLFKDPEVPRARAMTARPADPAEALDATVQAIWTLGCAAKFLWPVPDRGLSKRLHRIDKPTLVVWGEDDQLIPVSYAHEFGRRISDSKVVVLQDCGHIPQVEQYEQTLTAVNAFLAE